MRLLVIGSGGREHAIAWKLAQSPQVEMVFCAPGNAGTADEPKVRNIDIAASQIEALAEFAKANQIDLTVVGPEQPLVAGIVDYFQQRQLLIFGPSRAAAALEGSKAFAKKIMQRAGVATAAHHLFSDRAAAISHVEQAKFPLVVKADGLAAGKGVMVCHTVNEAVHFIQNLPAAAAAQILIEDYLDGVELSVLGICAGEKYLLLPAARDHKRLLEGNQGPNTGGMGAFTPVADVDAVQMETIGKTVFAPVLKTLIQQGTPFYGVLYAGLMLVGAKIYVLEFNVRFGDPECEPLLCHVQDDILPLLMQAANGNLEPQTLHCRVGVTLAVVLAAPGYPQSPQLGIALPPLPKSSTNDIKIFHAGSQYDADGVVRVHGGRVLVVVAHAADIAAARQKAYACIDQLGFTQAHYRRDIGC